MRCRARRTRPTPDAKPRSRSRWLTATDPGREPEDSVDVPEGRGFGVAAGLDPDVAAPLAARCQELGYDSMWSNDHPGALGLETLAAFAAAAPELDLGVGVMALDRHSPAEIAGHLERLGLDRSRLWIGVGAGFDERPLTTMSEAVPRLREQLEGVRVVLAAMGPRMSRLAGEAYDGAFFNWMTPAFAERSRLNVEAGAAGAERRPPPVFGYVRTAVGPDAEDRLAREESFYRDLHDGYRNHFERLDEPEGTVGIAAADADAAQRELAAYERALDVQVVRGLAGARAEPMIALAEAAAPRR
ncbi:MAG: LLM class flavin-dependent oxidoreductase [Solirubrobacterales bacterium]|nr:LLM class flavin-dependent oxidoreductase [Solirubrobacterales bacterium]